MHRFLIFSNWGEDLSGLDGPVFVPEVALFYPVISYKCEDLNGPEPQPIELNCTEETANQIKKDARFTILSEIIT